MLTTLRNSAQSWLIKVLLGIIVITFVISFGIGTFSNPKEVLVTVGSHEILVAEFLRQYEEQLDQLRRRFPENADALANQINLREQVMNSMINRYLLLQASEREGLRVSDKDVGEAVRSQSAFQINKTFDFRTYRAVLEQNNLTPAAYESRLREDMMLNQEQRDLLAGVIVNPQEVEQRYNIENERVEVSYLYVDPARATPAVKPNLKAQKAYYEKHQDAFTQPDQFKVRYFVLTLGDLEKGLSVSPRAVERYYERFADTQFTIPKQVRASHILMRLPANATPQQVEKVHTELEGVLAQARAGKNFAQLARKYSDDLTKNKGGDLGYFRKDEMVPAFANAAFALKVGQISDIVRTPFGLHIIKVTGVKPETKKPLSEVKAQIEAKLRSDRAEHRLDLELQRIPGRLDKEGIEAIAKELGVPVKTSSWFDGAQVLPVLGSTAPLYGQVKSLRKGEYGVWRRNPVQGHVFYQIAEKKKAFVKPFDTVQKKVIALTEAQQRQEGALAQAKTVFPQLKHAAGFTAYAKRKGLPVKTVSFTAIDGSIEGLGFNRDFQRAAFGLSDKQPFALSIKDNKAYLLHFKRRFFAHPEQAETLKKQVAARIEETLRQYVLNTEIERLRSQSPVKVLAPEYLLSPSTSAAHSGAN